MCVFRFRLYLQNGNFIVYQSTNGWTHVVLNYIGPNNGEGIAIYCDGEEVASDTIKSVQTIQARDGRVVAGRFQTDEDKSYTSVQVDELIFFNHFLESAEITVLHKAID